ncbi:unnamed protein product (macronuclear) [Paramecium tetraurelia]|uniref:Uncharacterized protein n=1 Tax=Paramecium tetraurelia TaxID=5888 RepID=A0EFL8_PARTE|nr:uncharacterized protein GSPATT00026432001 [Paramecium tetraurelia]CAK94109.1 unnamed protein product [Paramecium tetraurelia]|eukprot:XP_001461482.1 hypothetical protein (macronuclear) [Paramecium tetraurelia strain d4-2]
MLTSFEDCLYGENTAPGFCNLETDTFPFTQIDEFENYSGMLIEAQLQDQLSFNIDQPESESQSAFHNKIPKSSKQIHKKKYRFPRESKNYFKNIGPKLKEFIIENFSHIPQIMNQPLIKEFLDIQNQRHIKLHIQRLCETREGQAIAKSYFKNYRWAKSLVNDDLSSYFRLNSDWNN